LLEHAHAFEPIQGGRIYIEKLNGPFLFGDKGTPTEYSAGLKLAIDDVSVFSPTRACNFFESVFFHER
jgi:hypothetical protein